MDKELFIKESNELLALGQSFAIAMNALRDKYDPFEAEINELAEAGDPELQALDEAFKALYESIN